MVQDTLYNAVLIKSNEALINLGREFGFDVTEIEAFNALSKKSFDEKLWLDELGMYAPYDLRNKKHIKMKEIGSFVSLYAGIPNQERADQLIDYIDFLGREKMVIELCQASIPIIGFSTLKSTGKVRFGHR